MIDFLIESLELRRLFASAFPDANAQYMIELFNRAAQSDGGGRAIWHRFAGGTDRRPGHHNHAEATPGV